MTRLPWDDYFLSIARQVATRSTCPRRAVGAVIVRDRTILSTGYNGSVRGLPHCSEEGCTLENGHCVTTVHAEANALIQAARNGVAVRGAVIYSTSQPCWACFKLLVNAGIETVFYDEPYPDSRTVSMADRAGVLLVRLSQEREERNSFK